MPKHIYDLNPHLKPKSTAKTEEKPKPKGKTKVGSKKVSKS